MRAHGRAVTFTVLEDADRWGRHLADAGMPQLAAVDVGGRRQYVFGRDWRRQTVDEWVQHRARATSPPVATWPAASAAPHTAGRLPRPAFTEGVLEALRTWHTPRAVATNALLNSRLVPPGSPDPAADLRDAVLTALAPIRTDPAGVKAHEALTATYITASRTHRSAATAWACPTAPTAATWPWRRNGSPNGCCADEGSGGTEFRRRGPCCSPGMINK
jgi:hypothetical protein